MHKSLRARGNFSVNVLYVCGQRVQTLWTVSVEKSWSIHSLFFTNIAWVKLPKLMRNLYYKCTQTFPMQNVFFTPVFIHLYPLSTPSIKPIKNYM